MRVAIAYVFPNLQPEIYVPAARRFVASYLSCPGSPTESPELHVIVNGESAAFEHRMIFEAVNPIYHRHNNWAKDLGAFLLASQAIECDLLVCMGSHVNFWLPGWLDVVVGSFVRGGPGVYGAWAFHVPLPHIRTTFFWTAPELLASYPHLKSESDRYAFEHGRQNISLWSQKMGFEPWQVTWGGCYPMKHWHPVTLEESLALDQHTKRDLGI